MAKKKVVKKASEKTAKRKAPFSVKERENIKRLLIAHYGASKIAKALEPCVKVSQYNVVYKHWKRKMEIELEQQRVDAEAYYKTIDSEYKSIGRPKSELNWTEFDFLCSIGCTLEEIAGFFQLNKNSLALRVKEEFGETFPVRYEKLSQGVKISLRRAQIKKAILGEDGPMQKFLGINMLGQKNKIDFEGEVKVNSWVDLVQNLEDEEKKDAENSEKMESELTKVNKKKTTKKKKTNKDVRDGKK